MAMCQLVVDVEGDTKVTAVTQEGALLQVEINQAPMTTVRPHTLLALDDVTSSCDVTHESCRSRV